MGALVRKPSREWKSFRRRLFRGVQALRHVECRSQRKLRFLLSFDIFRRDRFLDSVFDFPGSPKHQETMAKSLVLLLVATALFVAYSEAEPSNGRAYNSVIGMLRKREPANMRGYNALYGKCLL